MWKLTVIINDKLVHSFDCATEEDVAKIKAVLKDYVQSAKYCAVYVIQRTN